MIMNNDTYSVEIKFYGTLQKELGDFFDDKKIYSYKTERLIVSSKVVEIYIEELEGWYPKYKFTECNIYPN